MCRKNVLVAAVLAALGVGILLGGWISSCILRVLLGAGSIAFGIFLLNGTCRHK